MVLHVMCMLAFEFEKYLLQRPYPVKLTGCYGRHLGDWMYIYRCIFTDAQYTAGTKHSSFVIFQRLTSVSLTFIIILVFCRFRSLGRKLKLYREVISYACELNCCQPGCPLSFYFFFFFLKAVEQIYCGVVSL